MTCSGLSCLKLDELLTFIKGIKDLDLYGAAHSKCCSSGTAVGADCVCPVSDKDHNKLCMFDYCMSWADLTEKMNLVNDTYNNDELAPALVATLFGSMLSFARPTSDAFDGRLPLFWRNTAEVIQITSGFLAAIYAGHATVQAAVKTEYYNSAAGYVGANFLAYGGVSWVGDLLGLFEVTWVIAYLLLAAGIGGIPLEVAVMYNKGFDGSLAGVEAQSQEFHYLLFAFLLSAGGWLSAEALKKSATTLVGFFDIQDSNGLARYETVFSGTNIAETSVDNATFLAIDVLHHTFTVGAYYAIAAALLYMPHELIKFSMDPKSVDLPDFNMMFAMFMQHDMMM
jgi:hypothetical protein